MNKTAFTLQHASLLIATGCLSSLAQADSISDSHATLALRNLYFNSDNRDGAAAPSKTEEWAQGFLLNYTSGYTAGTVGFGLDAMGLFGLTLDSGAGRHISSTMIPSSGDGAADQWASAGATAKIRVSNTEFKYGTLLPKIPVLMSSDGRLLPQSFQGGQVQFKEIDNLTLVGGALEHATGRGSTDRTGLAVPGGTQPSNKFYYAGADYKATPALTLQYYVGNLNDYYTQHFAGLNHVWAINDISSLSSDLRYFRTLSSGANGSSAGRADGYRTTGYTSGQDGEIDNSLWSAAFTYKLGGHAATLGYQSLSDGSNFMQLNQGSLPDKGAGGSSLYLWTDRLLMSFNRAGERTAFGQYLYDFAAMGVPGLKASVIYLNGQGIRTQNAGDQSEWERDISLDYVIQSGTFKGVALAWRNGMSRSQATRDGDQNRLIVSYTLTLF